MKYLIRYGLGGGFGGMTEAEVEEFDNEDAASAYAWEKACEHYDQYDGSNGLRSTEQIMEEDEVEEDEAQTIWSDEREGWLDYEAVPYDEAEHKEL